MTRAHPLAAIAIISAFGACATRRAEPTKESAKPMVIYVARSIRTLDPHVPSAEALAVVEGRISAVGSREDVLGAATKDAQVVELGHAVIVPGLADAHAHIAGLGNSLVQVSLVGSTSPEEVVARAKLASRSSYQGEWLIGRGWDQNDWAPAQRKFPTSELLDEAFDDVPVFLVRVDGHAAWVNRAALARAGITKGTKDPRGGRILRDASGAPTGVLIDNAIDLVRSKVDAPTREQREARLKLALDRCAQLGLTSVHDAGMDFATFEILRAWDEAGKLPLRVYAMADGQGDEAARFLERGKYEGRLLTMRAVKFLMDGALGSRGAALHAPYSDEPGQSGLLLLTAEELETRALSFMGKGFQVGVHAIGDRANSLVLDVLSRAMQATATAELRHRVEHAQIVRPQDIRRFAELKLIASMQPTHATSDMGWAEARLGKDRLLGAYAWRSLSDAGAALAFGSDFPVEDPNPLLGLYAARTRTDAQGKPDGGWLKEEVLDGERALQGFTRGAAYASFAEDRRGVLKAGMDADFVALSVDPVTSPPSALLTAKVYMTVVSGQPIYRSDVASVSSVGVR